MAARRTTTIETDRLRLRPLAIDDAAGIRRLAGDPRVAGVTARIPQPFALRDAIAWITERTRADAGVTWAIELLESGALVGAIGLTVELDGARDGKPHGARGALDYWIATTHWNQGLATEAASAALRHGFGALELAEIGALHLTRNPASGRVLLKCGLHHVGSSIDLVRGELEPVERYSITRAQYLALGGGEDDRGT